MKSTNKTVANAVAARNATAVNADMDVRKVEADANAWIAAIKKAAQEKSKAEALGKRLRRVFVQDWRAVVESTELQAIEKKIKAVHDDASYLDTSSTGFYTA